MVSPPSTSNTSKEKVFLSGEVWKNQFLGWDAPKSLIQTPPVLIQLPVYKTITWKNLVSFTQVK